MMQDPSGLPATTLDRLRALLSDHPRVEQAILYGSRAKGTYRPGSDIDLTLIGADLTYRDLAELAARFDESPLPYRVDLSLLAEIDNPDLIEHITRVGRVIYRRVG